MIINNQKIMTLSRLNLLFLNIWKRILTKNRDLVNCFDKDGRLSTPLHFAAGYNRLRICQYLIEMNANVLACDKGLLQPMYNNI